MSEDRTWRLPWSRSDLTAREDGGAIDEEGDGAGSCESDASSPASPRRASGGRARRAWRTGAGPSTRRRSAGPRAALRGGRHAPRTTTCRQVEA